MGEGWGLPFTPMVEPSASNQDQCSYLQGLLQKGRLFVTMKIVKMATVERENKLGSSPSEHIAPLTSWAPHSHHWPGC